MTVGIDDALPPGRNERRGAVLDDERRSGKTCARRERLAFIT
jgi:hypothetical protein